MAHFARLPITDAVLACLVGASIVVGDHAVAVRKSEVESLVADVLVEPLLHVDTAAGASFAFTATDVLALASGALIALRFLVWSVEVALAVLLGSWTDPERVSALSRLLAWIVSPLLAAAILLGDVHMVRSGEAGIVAAAVEAPARFMDAPLASFELHGRPMFVTPSDVVAMLSATIIAIRFLAWSLAPLVAAARGARRASGDHP
ncbi:MAG: hypothetical protein R6V44_15960 [Paracoccaceae bacterium]